MKAILALETGKVFYGTSVGIQGITVGEVVFNTALTGYQEILTDPSYNKQIITFTYPHIGNTGINFEDSQSAQIFAAGIIVKSLSTFTSNWRSKISLADFLVQQRIIGITGVDTRSLTILLRQHGALRGCIMAGVIDEDEAIERAKAFSGLSNLDLATQITTRNSYEISVLNNNTLSQHIVVVDYGVKKGIIDCLTQLGCRVTVVPAYITPQQLRNLKPDGIVLSNGPGDPAACDILINNIKLLINNSDEAIPILGICLGHQLLALALGAKTYKMNFGHHGSNHPVQSLSDKSVMITSQNHGFAVDELSLGADLKITHRSLFDNSLQGFRHKKLPLFGFQGHPEADPGPHDALNLFHTFIEAIKEQACRSV